MKRVLICSEYYSPAFKGGGPIQSLSNLTSLLVKEFTFSIYCSACDLGDDVPLNGVHINRWSIYPDSGINSFYAYNGGLSLAKNAMKSNSPDVVYINGIFSIKFNLAPLVWAKFFDSRVILAPRGMLHSGALELKSIKKKIFLGVFKLLNLHRNVTWHATDEQEKKDITKIFGDHQVIKIAANVPKRIYNFVRKPKESGVLRIIFLSLISEKKNLHVVLEALAKIKDPITFHIYGPIKDHAYWERCLLLTKNQIHDIEYKGAVIPSLVQKTLAEYDIMVLPTKGENFGHVIYESFSVGTPVLVSRFTPWGNLQGFNAGMTVESFDPRDWADAIEQFVGINEKDFLRTSNNALALAKNYFNEDDFKRQYNSLFS